MICGSSAGAVNAVAYASGMGIEKMIHLWKTYHRKKMYRVTLPMIIKALTSRSAFSPFSDTRPLYGLLEKHLDFSAMRASDIEVIITAISLETSQIKYFSNNAIKIEHLMAATAIPMLFPWQEIDGKPYWDGGVMTNIPIKPALEKGAKEIIVVLLSPVGKFAQEPPKTALKAAELIFEQLLLGSYSLSLPDTSWKSFPDAPVHQTPTTDSPQLQLASRGASIYAVAPTKMLGFKSLLNFSPGQAQSLIKHGYECAKMQLQRI